MAKAWKQKLDGGKPAHVEVLNKPFGGAPEGAKMLIATPRMVDDYMRAVPIGELRTVAQMKSELAARHEADICCPISTSIFARISAEAAIEETSVGVPLADITPFWRVIEEDGAVTKKLSCGPDFVRSQREAESTA